MECKKCGKIYKTNQTLKKHSKKCDTKEELKSAKLQIDFDINTYITFINDEIAKCFKNSKYNDDILEDILLDDLIRKEQEQIKFAKKLKQIQMNIGKIWQITIGNWKYFTDLGEGDISGLDVKSDKLNIIMEIKNRYNTDNASSRKTNYLKLASYKKANPEYICIYAVINDKKKLGKDEEITIENEKIRYLSGDKLLSFIFNDNKNIILSNLKIQLQNLQL